MIRSMVCWRCSIELIRNFPERILSKRKFLFYLTVLGQQILVYPIDPQTRNIVIIKKDLPFPVFILVDSNIWFDYGIAICTELLAGSRVEATNFSNCVFIFLSGSRFTTQVGDTSANEV